ncbi:MAG: DUF4920 domain-containing protein [Bacteroidetes bacterium MedPE-SWsnd-G2]|mgnify:CR=1 FL=1|nr:MAG: DUF4920 domain-containing protein [Bacteroidetes bacterium MedPE-SWsnd-G2]
MRKIALSLLAIVSLMACKNEKKTTETQDEVVQEVSYMSFGEEITDQDVVSAADLKSTYGKLAAGDTLTVKAKAKVKEVCQVKGCWMMLDINADEDVRVKFKDYGFFMPKNISGQEVIVHGKAYVNEVSVEEQRHYAEDAGKTEEEVLAITEAKKTMSFLADGVLLVE